MFHLQTLPKCIRHSILDMEKMTNQTNTSENYFDCKQKKLTENLLQLFYINHVENSTLKQIKTMLLFGFSKLPGSLKDPLVGLLLQTEHSK